MAVYGCSLAAYTVVRSLLGSGLPASRVALVVPQEATATPPPSSSCSSCSCFNDPTVDQRVRAVLEKVGVEAYYGFTLEGEGEEGEGREGEEEGRGLVFVGSDGGRVELECEVYKR